MPFRGIHAFQACLLNHSSISPYLLSAVAALIEGANIDIFLEICQMVSSSATAAI